ncbi:MAG: response regulator [Lachnospiraceae bacterium]|nr:response regulator [Lachnospiraceae bacterium]
MIRIMIVDDMPIFLEYLRGCIDWESYGFQICCEAHDGREALEKLEEYYPDVVLTDITMPYLNGLELSEKIVKDYPDISVILITGNNEFEYARKAVKIGVCDYIVKPFEKEELILSLLKLQDNMGKALENTTNESTGGDTKNRQEEALRALIYAGVTTKADGTSVADELFPGKWEEENYLVALLRLEMQGTDREKQMNWESMIGRMLNGRLEIDGSYHIFPDYENHMVVVMRFKRGKDMEAYKGYEFTDLIQVVKNQLNLNLGVALAWGHSLAHVRKAYDRALLCLNKEKGGKLRDLRKQQEQISYASLDIIYRLNKDLETLQMGDLENTINTLWNQLHENVKTSDNDPIISDMNLVTNAVSILMTNIINSGFTTEQIYGPGFSPEKILGSAESVDEMKDRILDMYRRRILFETDRQRTKEGDVAENAKAYIEANYQNNELSVADIAKALSVNQTYLRKMFKSRMNMTISEYLTQFRMQEARRLLTTTDHKLALIAEEVGYSDVSYFSNVFKKFYGLSPRAMSKGE